MVAADFDGQNGPDLAVLGVTSSETAQISIWLNDGTGRFVEQALVYKLPGYWQNAIDEAEEADLLAGADFDDDGKVDLAVPVWGVGALIYRGNGDGTFEAPIALDAGTEALSVTAYDLDGNGTPDLALATRDGIWVYLNAR